MKLRKTIVSLLILAEVFTISCTNRKDNRNSALQPSVNPAVLKAERFSLERQDSVTIVTITDPWQGADHVSEVYYLVERGKNIHVKTDPSHIIPVPVRNIICMSSTHLAMISALGEQNSISGISGIGYIYDDALKSRADSGYICEVGYDSGINGEVILKTGPDLIMMYGIGIESAGYLGKISELGVKVMFDADYLETDPLGKAEWIKLFGALYCKEKLADSIFSALVRSYNDLRSFIKENSVSRPSVMLGLPFRDSWFISPGNSYISKLISDAGGRYLWEESESSVSMPYGLEAVYLKSLEADYWLNSGNAESKRDIASLEPRLEHLPCYISGNIYNNTKRTSAGGGNDYWESGTLNPDLILKDIASILHPGIFGSHELIYYKKIE